jgi:hypothetical protein
VGTARVGTAPTLLRRPLLLSSVQMATLPEIIGALISDDVTVASKVAGSPTPAPWQAAYFRHAQCRGSLRGSTEGTARLNLRLLLAKAGRQRWGPTEHG